MTPETEYLLAKARKLLSDAEGMLQAGFIDSAGRSAYLAGHVGAQAFISEQTGRTVKTHRGVQAELHRLTKDGPPLDPELRAFLAKNFRLKIMADYEIDPGSEVSSEEAAEAIEVA